MKKRIVIIVVCLGLLLIAGAGLAAAGELSLPAWTVDSGGGASQGGSYTLSGTIGQPDAGQMWGGSYRLAGGLWAGEGAVQKKLYLPCVVR